MIPKKIIYSGRATIVFWQDGSKTVVKREKGAKDDRYQAVCSALAIKTYGTNSHFKKLIKDAENAKEIPKKKPPHLNWGTLPIGLNREAHLAFNAPDYLRGLW